MEGRFKNPTIIPKPITIPKPDDNSYGYSLTSRLSNLDFIAETTPGQDNNVVIIDSHHAPYNIYATQLTIGSSNLPYADCLSILPLPDIYYELSFELVQAITLKHKLFLATAIIFSSLLNLFSLFLLFKPIPYKINQHILPIILAGIYAITVEVIQKIKFDYYAIIYHDFFSPNRQQKVFLNKIEQFIKSNHTINNPLDYLFIISKQDYEAINPINHTDLMFDKVLQILVKKYDIKLTLLILYKSNNLAHEIINYIPKENLYNIEILSNDYLFLANSKQEKNYLIASILTIVLSCNKFFLFIWPYFSYPLQLISLLNFAREILCLPHDAFKLKSVRIILLVLGLAIGYMQMQSNYRSNALLAWERSVLVINQIPVGLTSFLSCLPRKINLELFFQLCGAFLATLITVGYFGLGFYLSQQGLVYIVEALRSIDQLHYILPTTKQEEFFYINIVISILSGTTMGLLEGLYTNAWACYTSYYIKSKQYQQYYPNQLDSASTLLLSSSNHSQHSNDASDLLVTVDTMSTSINSSLYANLFNFLHGIIHNVNHSIQVTAGLMLLMSIKFPKLSNEMPYIGCGLFLILLISTTKPNAIEPNQDKARFVSRLFAQHASTWLKQQVGIYQDNLALPATHGFRQATHNYSIFSSEPNHNSFEHDDFGFKNPMH